MDDRAEWLYKALSPRLNIRQYDGVTFETLGGPKGFVADIYQIHPKWEGDNLPDTLVVKIPKFGASSAIEKACPDVSTDEEHQAALVKKYHKTETFFYDLFSKDDPSPVAVPRIYFCHDGESPGEFPVIVMEDLSAYTVVDLVDGLNEKQLYEAVDELVKLHFYSFTHDEWRDMPECEENGGKGNSFPEIVSQFAKQLKEQHPDYFAKGEKLLELLGEGDWHKRYMDACANNKMVSVIAHGDLWAANFVWDGDRLKAILDWQMAHAGLITEDIMRILVTGTSIRNRRALTKKLLDYYYDHIKKIFADSKKEMPFTYEKLQETYREMLPYTAACTLFAVGMWSNSHVLKTGAEDEDQRVKELYDRLKDFMDETFEHQGQE